MREQDVGHFFILGFRGPRIPDWLRQFEKKYGLGGVILFDYNCQTKTYENNILSREQLKELCAEIRSLRSRPLIFIDQEGGKVRRLKEKLGFAPLPSQFQFNQLPLQKRKQCIEACFKELKELGIDFNLAPVIDLNLNPLNPDIGALERSYSARAEDIRTNVKILNSIAHELHLGLCLKHYPGLGGARVNSHEEITDLSDSIIEEQLNLFYELGQTISGNAILVSHGIVQPWGKNTPVSMSNVGVGKIRTKLPDVILISDDLQMQGLQKKYSSTIACKLGLKAGLDLLCIGNNLMPEDEKTLSYAEEIAQELRQDTTLREHLNQAFMRIQRVKTLFT